MQTTTRRSSRRKVIGQPPGIERRERNGSVGSKASKRRADSEASNDSGTSVAAMSAVMNLFKLFGGEGQQAGDDDNSHVVPSILEVTDNFDLIPRPSVSERAVLLKQRLLHEGEGESDQLRAGFARLRNLQNELQKAQAALHRETEVAESILSTITTYAPTENRRRARSVGSAAQELGDAVKAANDVQHYSEAIGLTKALFNDRRVLKHYRLEMSRYMRKTAGLEGESRVAGAEGRRLSVRQVARLEERRVAQTRYESYVASVERVMESLFNECPTQLAVSDELKEAEFNLLLCFRNALQLEAADTDDGAPTARGSKAYARAWFQFQRSMKTL